MAANTNEIVHDFFPFLREYKDGRIERLMGNEFIPPSIDPLTGVRSKDVKIAPQNDVAARIYLPKNVDSGKKLPLLVYFHGGGFIAESAFSPLYHNHLNFLVAEANVVAVSVNYRLAPEHKLPIPYEDSWEAIEWVASQFKEEGGEDWIKRYVDLNRVFIGGDSAGGNIAHNMGMRVGGTKSLDRLKVRGVYLNCPFISGPNPIGNESTHHMYPKDYLDRIWRYACPGTVGCEDPWINPVMDPNLSSFGCERLLVYVAANDSLNERGRYYKEALMKSGWGGDCEIVEVKGEDHVFSVISPTSENGMAMLKRVASFLNR